MINSEIQLQVIQLQLLHNVLNYIYILQNTSDRFDFQSESESEHGWSNPYIDLQVVLQLITKL